MYSNSLKSTATVYEKHKEINSIKLKALCSIYIVNAFLILIKCCSKKIVSAYSSVKWIFVSNLNPFF